MPGGVSRVHDTYFILLGAYLASLARNHSDPNPVQPGACAVLAVFLFFGTFVLNIIRMKMPKGIYTSVKYCINIETKIESIIANFGCVIACIVLTVSITGWLI